MENKDDIKKELEGLAPLLSQLKKKDRGFEVPTNYFNNLPDTIMDRIKAEEEPQVLRSPAHSLLDRIKDGLQQLLQPSYSLALASVAILVVAIFLLNPFSQERNSNISLAEVPDEVIADYVYENVDEFEMDLLIEVIDESAIEEQLQDDQQLDQYYMDEILEDLSDEELESLM